MQFSSNAMHATHSLHANVAADIVPCTRAICFLIKSVTAKHFAAIFFGCGDDILTVLRTVFGLLCDALRVT